jgi:NADPH:quinone reductase-like Zn-dependent oxidoreductase
LQAIGGDVVLVDGPDLAARVIEATGKAKIRLAIDAVGGSATDRLAQCLAVGGTVVNYGALSGEACKLAPGALIFRNITLRGFWLAFWYRNAAPAQQQAVFGELATLIARGELAVRVHATYPLSQIKDAVAAAATGGRHGKILLVP